jgi:acetyltransferase-like isoleucine patch superfamily enzyme
VVVDQNYSLISNDVKLGDRVKIYPFVNIYGCEIGDDCKIGTFVEIQRGAKIGNRVKVSSHTFICEGITIEDEVFIGHNVSFINDRFPRATSKDGTLQSEVDWVLEPTTVKQNASVGSGATTLCGLIIGENAIVGAGSVVIRDVPPNAIVAGNPARFIKWINDNEILHKTYQ